MRMANHSQFSIEDKTAFMDSFLEERDSLGTSLRDYAAKIDVRYYTFRDWYRDPGINKRYSERHEWVSRPVIKDSGNPFVRIG